MQQDAEWADEALTEMTHASRPLEERWSGVEERDFRLHLELIEISSPACVKSPTTPLKVIRFQACLKMLVR